MSLFIGHGNGHNKMSLIQYVREANADSFSAQESQQVLNEARDIPGHRVTVAGDGWTEERNRAKSTFIVTKNSHANLGEMTRKVSERIPNNLKFAPDRVLVCSMYEHPVATAVGCDGVAHFSLHPNAGRARLTGNNATDPVVREYREALLSARRHIAVAKRDGLLPILTGDLQLRQDDPRKPWHPLDVLAAPMDLGYRVTRIDWLLFDKRVFCPEGLKIKPLDDHNGFTARLEARR